MRRDAQDEGGHLAAAIRQLLLDAVAELGGSEQMSAEFVDQKQAQQRALVQTKATLRAILAIAAPR